MLPNSVQPNATTAKPIKGSINRETSNFLLF
jgi:hypothetical protein